MANNSMSVYLVMDERGILDPERAAILSVEDTVEDAILACKVYGGGCVIGAHEGVMYWKSGDGEWNRDEEKPWYRAYLESVIAEQRQRISVHGTRVDDEETDQ